MTGAPALRLAARPEEFPVAETNGPGRRYVLWVQGCALRCTQRCLNPELLEGAGGVFHDVGALVSAVAARRALDPFEGISVLGGEPLDQCASLAAFLAAVQSGGLSTVVYTGHTIENVLARAHGDAALRRALESIDLLVEGPYQERHAHRGALWRGSMNQRIVFLSPRYSVETVKAALLARSEPPSGDVNGAQIRLAWDERLPCIAPCDLPQSSEVSSLLFARGTVTAWIPELSKGEPLPSPKGAVFHLGDSGLSAFGFQDRDLVERVLARLGSMGIEVEA